MPIVDCVYERGQFFLPLSLNGSGPQYFIFDTGAGVSAVDATLADELGLPKIAHTELAGTAGVLEVDQVRIGRIMPLCRGRARLRRLSWYGLTPTKQDLSAFTVPVPGARGSWPAGATTTCRASSCSCASRPRWSRSRAPRASRRRASIPQLHIPFFLDNATIVRVSGMLDEVDAGSAAPRHEQRD